MTLRLGLPLCLLLAGCIAPEQGSVARLKPGSWVEAKGRMVNGKPLVDEIDELERGESDKREKVEVTAGAKPVSATELQVVGVNLQTDVETEYEDERKDAIDPFMPADGEWVRLKLREKDGAYKVRTMRKSETREQFKVEGELTAIDYSDSYLTVGGFRLPFQQGASIGTLGDRASDDPLALFKADDQKGVPFTIQASENLFLGGSASVDWTNEREFDLDPTSARDQVDVSYTGKFDGLWLFDDKASYAIFEVDAGRGDSDREGREVRTNERVQITRAALSLQLFDGIQLIAGRQDYEDEREWLFDRTMDGLRGIWTEGDWRLDIGAAVGRDTAAPPNDTENTQLMMAMLRYKVTPDWSVGAYALKREDDTSLDHEPLLFGLRSIDDAKYGFTHWAELSFARGHSRWGINDGGPIDDEVLENPEDIKGWAFDVLAKYTFENDFRPCLALGYAYGSGEKDSRATMGYRQSGYNDNNAKIGGVTSVRYYGDLLRPELSNIAIFTLAGSIRPIPNTSVSLVYHTYLQDYAAQDQPLTDLRIGSGSAPNGRDPDLGSEIDLILGYRVGLLTLEAVLSRFEPGPAFDNQDAATKIDFTARISF